MAQTDRDVLFSNEALLIGMLQAVSGATLAIALSQSEALLKFVGQIPLLLFLTIMGLALICAVLAAFWKHQYKLWDVKAQASQSRNEVAEAQHRVTKSKKYLHRMRFVLVLTLILLVVGIVELIAAFWFRALCQAQAA
jgi:ATP/ADP translocase